MIVAAGKYSKVPGQGERKPAPPARRTSGQLVEAAVRFTNKKRTRLLQQKFPHVFIPQFAALIGWKDWATRGLRPGGMFTALLDWERRTSAARFRSVARARRDYQHNPKAETRLVASIPVPEFHRARQVDPHFWHDNQNLRNYKRDNPEAFIKL
jgi:hypothetical protein